LSLDKIVLVVPYLVEGIEGITVARYDNLVI